MSLNLNVGEYEGGYLRFPEYAPHLYKPDTGSAIIFSGSLMHEATPVTSGIRFVLLNFFYGDKDAESRNSYEERIKNDYDAVVRING
jgi:predicted 2-oxoglutarate/Fe(II)-dependent dioxygenase YbiX